MRSLSHKPHYMQLTIQTQPFLLISNAITLQTLMNVLKVMAQIFRKTVLQLFRDMNSSIQVLKTVMFGKIVLQLFRNVYFWICVNEMLLLIILLIISITTVSLIGEISVFGSIDNSSILTIKIASDRNEYTLNQYAKIYITFNSTNSSPIKLVLQDRDTNGTLLYESSSLISKVLTTIPITLNQQGLHNITVTATQNDNMETAITYFKVISIYDTSTARFLYLSIGFFIALIVLVSINRINRTLEEILRFLFLSGIVLSILLALLFTDLEFGEYAAVGIVKIKNTDNALDGWVINVGGIKASDNSQYEGGLQIPIYVIIFGFLSGYIRYLYKTSRLFIDDGLKAEYDKIRGNLTAEGLASSDIQRQVIFYQSLKDIMLFFLSPLLAVVVWFLFSQWEPLGSSPEVLAVFSFAAGLTTTEIISAVENFTKTNLTNRTSDAPAPQRGT